MRPQTFPGLSGPEPPHSFSMRAPPGREARSQGIVRPLNGDFGLDPVCPSRTHRNTRLGSVPGET